jgi:hypothetical protein
MVLILLTAFPYRENRDADPTVKRSRPGIVRLYRQTHQNRILGRSNAVGKGGVPRSWLNYQWRVEWLRWKPTQHTNGIIAENIQNRTLVNCRWVLSPTPFRAV